MLIVVNLNRMWSLSARSCLREGKPAFRETNATLLDEDEYWLRREHGKRRGAEASLAQKVSLRTHPTGSGLEPCREALRQGHPLLPVMTRGQCPGTAEEYGSYSL